MPGMELVGYLATTMCNVCATIASRGNCECMAIINSTAGPITVWESATPTIIYNAHVQGKGLLISAYM